MNTNERAVASRIWSSILIGEIAEAYIPHFDPFPNRIERVAIDHDVLQKREQRMGVAAVLQCQRQLFLEPHALDEAVQNRERAHTQPAQAQSFLLHEFT